jgi:hypothetical protein
MRTFKIKSAWNRSSGQKELATVSYEGDKVRDEAWANAALICAAPDLLTACQIAVSQLEIDSHYAIVTSVLKEAIARAEKPLGQEGE